MIAPGTLNLLEEPGPFCQEGFEAGKTGIDYFLNCKILVIGAGGLGCELLKSLALTGFKHIHVIDMDTIDVSNLNRQFLFRQSDVGKPKSVCAAEFIKRRIPEIDITPHFCKIQDFDDDFYKQFDLVIAGLDSVNARLWISDNLCRIARETNGEYTIPLIDGGSEGWKGHVKLIIPLETACMRCQSDLFPPPVVFQSCTIASNPRQPEHCIVWAKELQWEKLRKGESIDGDNDEHINWIMEQAKLHAKKFKLNEDDITFKLTKGVVKNIIPAIASTQAVVAAQCTTEALKYLTCIAPKLQNNVLFAGDAVVGVNWTNFNYEKNNECIACGQKTERIPMVENETLKELMDRITSAYNFKVSSMRTGNETLYLQIDSRTRENLDKKVEDLVNPGEIVAATSRETTDVFQFVLTKE